LAGVFRYVDNHFHTPTTWFEDNQSLADNADVRERLFDGFRTELIALAEGQDPAEVVLDDPGDTQDDTADSTDDDAGDDAATDAGDDEPGATDPTVPVTDERIERDQGIEEILLDVFDSDLYDEVFDSQLQSIQAQVIRAAELPDEALLRDNGDVVFDARGLYPTIYQRLAADPRTAEITQNAVPETFGVYSVADRDTTIDAAWWFVENGPSWRGLTFALAILSLIGAVLVAERRPSRAIQFGAGMVGLALVVIVVVYIVRAVVPLLAGGSGSDGAVVAVYAANIAPLVSMMVRILIYGAILAAVGGVARLIWPDDWVYGHVTDDRGVRSIRRRRGTPESEQPQQTPVAAAVPVAYPGYAQPYPTYPAWGAPYPGQPYGPAPYQPYPAGPYAQPTPVAYQTQTGAIVGGLPAGPEVVPTGENPSVARPTVAGNGPPADAAQTVPKVVASAEAGPHSFAKAIGDDGDDSPGQNTGPVDDVGPDTVATSAIDVDAEIDVDAADEPSDGPDAAPAASADTTDEKRGDGWDADGEW
jgi:hypothetical protein